MLRYLAKRLIGLVPLLIGITIVSFCVIGLARIKPTVVKAELNPKISVEDRERIEKIYGLDLPLHIRYVKWLGKLVRFDFGTSFVDERPVIKRIAERIPITLLINILSMGLIIIIAMPIGIVSSIREGSVFDRTCTVGVFIGFATPGFWLALLLMTLFGVHLRWLPISGIKSLTFAEMNVFRQVLDVAWHLILPVFVSAFGGLAGFSRYMRSNMLGVLGEDYIRTARAKGLPERDVIYKHALRNAMLPIVTILGLSVPGLIGGSVIFESIFAIPGMGRLFYDSVMAGDIPTIMGILVIGAVLTLIGNLVADIAYSYVDPRIRVGAAR